MSAPNTALVQYMQSMIQNATDAQIYQTAFTTNTASQTATNSVWAATNQSSAAGTTISAATSLSRSLSQYSTWVDSTWVDDALAPQPQRGRYPPRDFNKYLNASDLLGEFFDYLATLGIKKRDINQINVKLFVAWLVIRAAEADGEAKPQAEVLMLEDGVKKAKPRCRHCQRFITHRRYSAGVQFCSGAHSDKFLDSRGV